MSALSDTPTTSTSTPAKSLLDLPLELRIRVYEYALAGYDTRYDEDDWPVPPFRYNWLHSTNEAQSSEHMLLQPKLALVCSSMRDEVLEVFLKLGFFDLVSDHADTNSSVARTLARWRYALDDRARHIRRISFEVRQLVRGVHEGLADNVLHWSVSTEYILRLGTSIEVSQKSYGRLRCLEAYIIDFNPPLVNLDHDGCACELKRTLEAKAKAVGGFDGRALLDLANDLLAAKDNMWRVVCDACGKTRLVIGASGIVSTA